MYVKETLPDNTREKGRSSTGSSDTHRNTQHHKSYLDKQILIEKEKEREMELALEGESRVEDGERDEEYEEYRAGENSNENEIGSQIEFSSSVKSLFSDSGTAFLTIFHASFLLLFPLFSTSS